MPQAKIVRKVALTGGGTAGHVMPHLALIPELNLRGIECFYIGSHGIEKEIITGAQVSFYTIQAGKLRRYFSIKNFFDLFRFFWGIVQSFFILRRERPDVVFSKGGFVSVPVCYAAALLRIRVITHESDLTPGLATRLIAKIADRVLCTFSETERFFPNEKCQCVGAAIRPELFAGSRQTGLELCHFKNDDRRPIVLVMGGSLGAQRINDVLLKRVNILAEKFRFVHLTGKGKQSEFQSENYRSFEFLNAELKHILACCDLVVARAGANSIFEFLALRKPMLLIPLEIASRGDQVDNAASFSEKHWALVLRETNLSEDDFVEALIKLSNQADDMKKSQAIFDSGQAIQLILRVLLD